MGGRCQGAGLCPLTDAPERGEGHAELHADGGAGHALLALVFVPSGALAFQHVFA